MNTLCKIRTVSVWVALAIVLVQSPPRLEAAAFGITPANITNDYNGAITLVVNSLAVGKTNVLFERFADLNGNGTIDPGEPLVMSFNVIDGQVPLIGGIRNKNVPGDDDGALNQQVSISLSALEFGLTAAGKSVLRASDPQGSFSLTQSFSVAQKVYPQGIAGRLTSSATGLPIANTIIAVFGPFQLNPIFAETDSNGNYTVYTLPGYFGVAIFKSGFISDQTAFFPILCGQFLTNNQAFAPGTLFISGRVTDSGSGAGIAGISVDATSTNSLYVETLTDTNGNYALAVSANQWKVRPDKNGLSQLGYLGFIGRTNVTVSGVSVSNINFQVPKASAMTYGTVRDNHFAPVIGVALAGDDSAVFNAAGQSFASDGSYSLGVAPGASWNVGPQSDNLAALGYSGQGTNVSLANNQALRVDFSITRTNLPSLINPVRLSSSQFRFVVQGAAGQTYSIQALTNLNVTNWLGLLTTNAPCDSVTILDSQATNSSRYYRAIVAP